MQCINHLKQLSLACLTIYDADNLLPNCGAQYKFREMWKSKPNATLGEEAYVDVPAGWTYRGELDGACGGFVLPLMPFIEQTAVYTAIAGPFAAPNDFAEFDQMRWSNARTYTYNNNTLPNPYASQVSIFLCPSDANAKNLGNSVQGKITYVPNAGDIISGVNAMYRGPFNSGQNMPYTLASISDGTSNTILISERATSIAGSASISLKGGISPLYVAWWSDGTTNGTPFDCMSEKSGSQLLRNHSEGDVLGTEWRNARSIRSIFHTILPPNSPTCAKSPRWEWNQQLVSASSYHSGGASVARADGSVSFVSETVSCGSRLGDWIGYGDSGMWSGQSPYGVWGALGSMSGGESASL
jgi:prepilin-type processing-associated H-X9-DG protein